MKALVPGAQGLGYSALKGAKARHGKKSAAPHRRKNFRGHARPVLTALASPTCPTTLISAELGISPGNLYYHYPAKDELINSLFDRYERSLSELLNASDGVRDVEDAWFFMHSLFELIWQYRFLYRDLNDLLSKNRRLETHFQWVLKNKTRAVRSLLDGMSRAGAMSIDSREVEATATSMVVVLTYWLSYEYVRDPRRALEPENSPGSLAARCPARTQFAGALLGAGPAHAFCWAWWGPTAGQRQPATPMRATHRPS